MRVCVCMCFCVGGFGDLRAGPNQFSRIETWMRSMNFSFQDMEVLSTNPAGGPIRRWHRSALPGIEPGTAAIVSYYK